MLTIIDCLFSPIDEISCAPWPSKSSKNACTSSGGDYIALNKGLDISKTMECEKLCKRQKSNGCCYLSDTAGCYWKPGAISHRNYDGGGAESTTVTCHQGNQYLVLKSL